MNNVVQDRPVESLRIKIGQLQLINSDGQLVGELSESLQKIEITLALYRAMVLNRLFDEQAVTLQRTGQLGTFASALGQEAPSVGAAFAMQKDDLFVPSFREQGGQLVRGVLVSELLSFWGGDERGSVYTKATKDFPVCIPVGSQYPQAAGAALAFKLKGEANVVVVFGGDGSTSKGDFYEGLNMAGVWGLPVIFLIVNNQWAISTPRSQQTHAVTLAQKALAAGVPGIQVDGNDVLAVYQATSDAIEKARGGGGPTLIEAVSYRMGDHTTADDASRYRAEAEVDEQEPNDPIKRLKLYLINQYDWSEMDDKKLFQSCGDEIAAGVTDYLATDSPTPVDIFDHLFAQLPAALNAQRDSVAKRLQKQ